MLRDFVLELVAAPSNGATITLPGVSPTGRVTWAAGFVTSQPVLYVLDDSVQEEWGVGALNIGAPSTIARPVVVLGNSAGTTARLNFAGTTRCYCALPSKAMLSAISGGIARNLLHNGMDRVQQRGAGPWTSFVYTSDRWSIATNTGGGTRSVTIATLSDAARTAIGDEEAAYGLQYVFSGGSAAGDIDLLHQQIEGVRRTAGKTVTVSFWAIAAAGTPKVGIGLQQVFGTGGSPSALVVIAAQTVTLSTTWTRYSLTFAVPSVAGKTFGTTLGTDYLEVDFWLSSGSTFNAQSGSIGVQAATVTLFGRQLEIGSYATPLEKQDIRYDLANCQRFYQIVPASARATAAGGGQSIASAVNWPTMRAAPTTTLNSAGTVSNANTPSLGVASASGGYLNFLSTAAGDSFIVGSLYNLAADL